MEQKEIRTNVEIKYFGKKLTFDKDITPKDYTQIYIYQLKHNKEPYILKGHKVETNSSLIQIYEKYYLVKALGSLTFHIAKPLSFDYAIELNKDKVMTYIEFLYKLKGELLKSLYYIDIELIYSMARQSLNALFALHNIGAHYIDITLVNMMYNRETYTLQLIDLGNPITSILNQAPNEKSEERKTNDIDFVPPELIYVDKSLNSLADFQRADVYCWAICMCSSKNNISYKLPKAVRDNNTINFGLKTEEEYKELIQCLISNSHFSIKVPYEETLKKAFDGLITDALNYRPEKRPSVKELLCRMKRIEWQEGIDIKYLQMEPREIRNVKDILLLNKGGKMVKLMCGHEVCKDYLVRYVLRLFFKKKLHNYNCFCTVCKGVKGIKSLPLDCNCVWTSFGTRIETNYIDKTAKCQEGKSLSLIDLGLINDYVKDEYVILMAIEYPEIKYDSLLKEKFRMAMYGCTAQTIAYALKHTKLIEERWHFYIENDEDSIRLGEALRKNISLIRLEMKSKCSIEKGGKSIGEGLKYNITLTELEISDASFTDEAMRCLSEGLKSNKSLINVFINKCGITEEGGIALGEALKFNRSIKDLQLNNNNIGEKGGTSIGEALRINLILENIGLAWNNIGTNAGRIIGESLKINRTLTKLDLCNNKIGTEGGQSIGEALKINKVLKYLNINYNNIKIQGGIAIAEALKVNRVLKELYLAATQLGDSAGEIIAEALEVNDIPSKLDLYLCSIGDKGAEAIGRALKINKGLTNLELDTNKITHKGAVGISEGLKINKTLKRLNLNTNLLKNEGIKVITEALRVNTTLEYLSVRGNLISSEALTAMKEAASKNLIIAFNP